MKFELHSTEVLTLLKWQKAIQKKINKIAPKDPYTNKCYGKYHYSFSHNSGIGTVCIVTEEYTNEKCDITNYKIW